MTVDRRRRFTGTQRSTDERGAGAEESLSALKAELVLLREENARFKAAQHQRPDVGRLLERARSMRTPEADPADLADETAQMLVEGLVIRESLLELCQELERSMVVFEARLNALARAPGPLTQPEEPSGNAVASGNGHVADA